MVSRKVSQNVLRQQTTTLCSTPVKKGNLRLQKAQAYQNRTDQNFSHLSSTVRTVIAVLSYIGCNAADLEHLDFLIPTARAISVRFNRIATVLPFRFSFFRVVTFKVLSWVTYVYLQPAVCF